MNSLRSANRRQITGPKKLKPFKCTKCGLRFVTEGHFIRHRRTIHQEVIRAQLKCDECPRLFIRKIALVAHVKKMHPPPLKCLSCDKTFKKQSHRYAHERMMHSKTKYPCKFCKLLFKNPAVLKTHIMYRHLKNKQLHNSTHDEVPSVSKWTRKKTSKIVPNKTPYGVEIVYANKFTCAYCPKMLNDLKSKYTHERMHTGERPYDCRSCEASFHLKETRDSHERECNRLDTAIWCKFCDYHSFSPKFLPMETHYRRKHGFEFKSDVELEFYGRECSSRFATVSQNKAGRSSIPYKIVTTSDEESGSESNDEAEESFENAASEANDRGEESFENAASESNDRAEESFENAASESYDRAEESFENSISGSNSTYFENKDPLRDEILEVSIDSIVQNDNKMANEAIRFDAPAVASEKMDGIVEAGGENGSQRDDVNDVFQINDKVDEIFKGGDSQPAPEPIASEKKNEIQTSTRFEQPSLATEVPESSDELIRVLQDDGTKEASVNRLGECNKPQIDQQFKQEKVVESQSNEEGIPVDEKLVKYEIEVAQLDSKLKEIFQNDETSENCITLESDVPQIPRLCPLVDLTDDDGFESRIIVIDDDD